MPRSRARRRTVLGALSLAVTLGATTVSWAESARDLLDRASQYIGEGRYDDAAAALEAAAQSADGDARREAWFRLAGLKSSVEEADALYRRIVEDNSGGVWAKRSQLEMAKVQYALGNYNAAYHLLSESDACSVSEEACLFAGLCAIQLKRYEDAREPLSRVRQGQLHTWAYMSLAEVDMGLERRDDACNRYESLSSAMISPTAIYRFGECLEDRGEVDAAKREYREIIKNFRDTPEAVLAAEKLQVIDAPAPRAEAAETPAAGEHEGTAVLESGFTLQFGSFLDRGNAIKLSARIKRVFPGVRIDSELVNYREYYRVRYGYFHTRDEAQATGRQISREINESFSIMPLP